MSKTIIMFSQSWNQLSLREMNIVSNYKQVNRSVTFLDIHYYLEILNIFSTFQVFTILDNTSTSKIHLWAPEVNVSTLVIEK